MQATHKLDLYGNHKPTIRGADEGIWRRMKLIPWLVTIAAEDRDKTMPRRLLEELPGILNWALEGCLEWQRLGLCEPDEVRQAGDEYRSESDVLGAFLRDWCEFASGAKCARKILRKRYETWCEELGHKPVGARKLAERLRSLGVVEAKVWLDGATADGWSGVQIRDRTYETIGPNEPSLHTLLPSRRHLLEEHQ
jgi:putative DNA primase/helicase